MTARLTLRPTGLSSDPDRKDYSVLLDGREIGRLYETATARAEVRWFWGFHMYPLGPLELPRDGRAATLEEAKVKFRQCMNKWRAWAKQNGVRKPARSRMDLNSKLSQSYLYRMLWRPRPPAGFIEPCLPSTASKPPSGPNWF